MGSGINMARVDAPEHAQILDDFRDQLLIVLIKRLGGKITIPISEADNTGGNLLAMSVDIKNKTFNFEVKKKQ